MASQKMSAAEIPTAPQMTQMQDCNDQQLYREFLGIAESMGKARGWAYHLFVAKRKTKPLWWWRNLTAAEPSSVAMGFAKHRLIRFAKDQQKGRHKRAHLTP